MKKLSLAVMLCLSATMASAKEAAPNNDGSASDKVSSIQVAAGKDLAADKTRTGVSVRGAASTLGAGGEIAWRFNDKLGVRAPFGSADADFDGEVEGYDIEGSVTAGGVGLMVDYFPMGGAFHVSGGLFHTGYEAEGVAHDVSIDGVKFDVAMDFKQKRDINPALAMGWDWQIGNHGLVTMDLGAILGSGFDVNAKESSGIVPQDRVDQEIADLRDAAGKAKVLPYFKLGIGFKF